MNKFKNIFIRYFSVIFSVLLVLVLLEQYINQGQIEVLFSLIFPLVLAMVGATIGAIFIGGYRKLEAEELKIRPIEYIEVDPEILKRWRHKIHSAKRNLLFLFAGFFPVGILSFYLNSLLNINFLYFMGLYLFLIMCFDFYFVLISSCPRCGNWFFWRMSGIGFRNFNAKHCLNCGLEI